MTYIEQLRHPNWQRKRLETLGSANFTCESCGDTESPLHVHHCRYIKGRKAWEYERWELRVLCESCHRFDHGNREALDLLLCAPNATIETISFMLLGFIPWDAGEDKGVLRTEQFAAFSEVAQAVDYSALCVGVLARQIYSDRELMLEVCELVMRSSPPDMPFPWGIVKDHIAFLRRALKKDG